MHLLREPVVMDLRLVKDVVGDDGGGALGDGKQDRGEDRAPGGEGRDPGRVSGQEIREAGVVAGRVEAEKQSSACA